MSKVDALRALREARYAANAAATKPATGTPAAARRPAAAAKPAKAATSAVPAATSEENCGHRNMSGRGCTRPLGHSEKSHRYAPKA